MLIQCLTIAIPSKIVKMWEQPKLSNEVCTDKQNVVYTTNELLFNLKKEEKPISCYHMGP